MYLNTNELTQLIMVISAVGIFFFMTTLRQIIHYDPDQNTPQLNKVVGRLISKASDLQSLGNDIQLEDLDFKHSTMYVYFFNGISFIHNQQKVARPAKTINLLIDDDGCVVPPTDPDKIPWKMAILAVVIAIITFVIDCLMYKLFKGV